MSATIRTRRRLKYTEQPFPTSETNSKAEVNQQLESRLFKIPRELRTKIYDMAYQNTMLPVDVAALFYCDGFDAPHSAALILTWCVAEIKVDENPMLIYALRFLQPPSP
jgi:hypothetical protein